MCHAFRSYHFDIVPVTGATQGRLSAMTIAHADEARATSTDWKLYLVQVGGLAHACSQ